MGKLVKSELNTHNAKQFVESINETANSLYYVYIGKHTAFPNDLSPPTANNSNESSFYQQYRDMIYGKQITTSDVKHMVDKNAWSNGTVYAHVYLTTKVHHQQTNQLKQKHKQTTLFI